MLWARRPPTACASTAPTPQPAPRSPTWTPSKPSTSTLSDEIASLADLRKAPLVEEEYHGPLLMSADAATDTLQSLLCRRGHGHAAGPRH